MGGTRNRCSAGVRGSGEDSVTDSTAGGGGTSAARCKDGSRALCIAGVEGIGLVAGALDEADIGGGVSPDVSLARECNGRVASWAGAPGSMPSVLPDDVLCSSLCRGVGDCGTSAERAGGKRVGSHASGITGETCRARRFAGCSDGGARS